MPPVSLPTPSLSPTAYDRAREQATELEGVFLNTLMKEMFASIGTEENVMGGGFAEETWRGLQAEQFANAMARAGGIGLADAIVADLLVLQEGAPTHSAPLTAGAYQ
jgi:peptidoglycan hydrolase FlgJ